MKAVVLDDDKAVCEFIASILEESGVECEVFLDPIQALASMNGDDYDFAFIDIALPNMDGLEFSRHFRERYPGSDIVFITGSGDYNKAVQAIKVGAYDFLRKAFRRWDIRLCVARLIEKRRLYQAEKRREVLDFANKVAFQLMHELRNPLMAIGGFARLAHARKCSPDRVRQYTRIIFDQSLRLERVVDQVLEHLKTGDEEL
ncbi:MAG: response regulator [Deltaproteobacteria bacterium]|jgi:DNA-binding NtrC family response regulator